MNAANKKELINAAVKAWLSVGSPTRAVIEIADEIGLSLSNQQIAEVLIEALSEHTK